MHCYIICLSLGKTDRSWLCRGEESTPGSGGSPRDLWVGGHRVTVREAEKVRFPRSGIAWGRRRRRENLENLGVLLQVNGNAREEGEKQERERER
ncbi:hypothetical protein TIFTF001_013202 [Ficus carica]|uniref:Uncharacterized protein n=1 Tax=Ficus carica TaxID=3494 RepID=A0AA87ZX95_FICCA|nr:hypothetical protein TIFTF001_013202 [Ficus carica]